MKKGIKILSIIIICILALLLLVGCGKNEDTNKSKVDIERGKWENNVYTNEFANIKFTLPDGWVSATDEEIATMMDVGVEALNQDQQKLAELSEQMSLYDMVANNPETGASIMVMFEKTALEVSPELYLGNLKKGLEEIDALEYNVDANSGTKTIGGEEYRTLEATIPAYNMVQKYYVKQIGNYFVDILVTYMEGTTDEATILSYFE